VPVQRPLQITGDPPRLTLLPGRPRSVLLTVRNALDRPVTARLVLASGNDLQLNWLDGEPGEHALALPMEAGQETAVSFTVMALSAGLQQIDVLGTVADDASLAAAHLMLPVPVVAPGMPVAFVAADPHERAHLTEELRLEDDRCRLLINPSGVHWRLQDALDDHALASGQVVAGPPY
jgi:hypothetical protein